jgi:TP901 family phage tail tape measure protein
VATEVGVGYVRLIPSAQGFGKESRALLVAPMSTVGAQAGEAVTRSMAASIAAGMQSVGSSITSVGSSISGVGQQITAGVTLPVAAMGTAVLSTAGDFEAAMNGVRAVTNATGSDFEDLTGLAREMGAETQFSATEAAHAMEFLGMAGFDTNQIMSSLPDVLNLAAAGGVELARSADIASNIMSGFGIEASEMGRVSDVLAVTLTSTNVNLENLGEAMKYAAPLAQAAGWSFEETAAAIGFLGNAGIQGSMAGTGLNSILATLADTSSTGGRRLAEFGVAAQDANGQVRPLTDVLTDLADEGAGVADVISIFGLEAGPKLQALLGQGSEGVRELIADLGDSEGAAQRMADIRMEGLNGEIKTLKSAFQDLLITIGDSGFLDWATDLARSITDVIRKMAETSPATLKFLGVLALGAAVVGPLVIVLGAFVSGLGQLVRVGGLVVGVIRAISAALLANPIGLILTLVGLLVAALIWAYNESETFRAIVDGAFRAIGDAAMWLWETLVSAWDWIVEATQAAWAWVEEYIITPLVSAYNAAVEWVSGLVEWIAAKWEDAKAWTAAAWDAVYEAIIQPVVDAYNGVVEWFSQLPGAAQEWFGSMADWIGRKIDEAIEWITGLPRRAKESLSGIGETLVQAGKDLIDGFIRGIKSIGGQIKESIMGFVRGAWESVKSFFGISSPSKLMIYAGEMVGDGLVYGLEVSAPPVADAAHDLAVAARPALDPAAAGDVRSSSSAVAVAPAVVTVDGTGLPRALAEWLRHAVRVQGGGSVQAAFGR